jgi:hypothetical protein
MVETKNYSYQKVLINNLVMSVSFNNLKPSPMANGIALNKDSSHVTWARIFIT